MSDEFDPAALNIESVPVPDHLASGADETPPPPLSDPVNVPNGESPKRRRRLIPGSRPEPGSRDMGFRRDRKIPKERPPLPPIPAKGFAPGVEKMYGTLALAVMPIDMELATAIISVAPEAAKAWDDLARQNQAVRRILVAMMQTTAVGAVVAAHMPILLLVMSRVMKDDPRISMIGTVLAQQAEQHANGENPEAA